MNPQAEKGVANVFMAAIVCVIAGVIFSILFLPLGLRVMAESKGTNMSGIVFIGLGPVLFLGGLVLAGVGLLAGFRAASVGSGPQRYANVQVRSRFAVNTIGEMIFTNFEYDAPGGELFVQMMMPDGSIHELKTAWAVFNMCGEGMWGTAVVNGDWLSSFVPAPIGVTQLGNDPYDRSPRP